ncbi:Collagen type IV alpha-3-binding protein [Armadillidium nasatum]|uniref:Collagen type IV alpha-3-binding protein n=1 Tax=Armadillidium nasatum TaxID=96803 RepID=A0A5N5SMZ6_9CRUS|nr:Collagen type IV alpha-3-binding protein [Armadillidium nasatum]
MSEDFGIQLSEEESEEENTNSQKPCKIQGTLCKWTNYIHGWQNRYIILQDGKLSYYKSENETSFGCRGSISVQRATVKPHEIDECRFDVCLNDCAWYLRTSSPEERQQWVDAIEKQKECNSVSLYGSNLSLTHSTTSSSSFKRIKGGPHDPDSVIVIKKDVIKAFSLSVLLGFSFVTCMIISVVMFQVFREKLAEIETYREIVVKQMEALQTYFDACAHSVQGSVCNGLPLDNHPTSNDTSDAPSMKCSSPLPPVMPSQEVMESHAPFAIDFRGEALTFKATTAGILTTLSHCVEVMNQREDSFKRRLEKEVDKRKKLEEKLKNLSLSAPPEPQTRYVVMGSPDYEEGPHSVIGEEEFYDAIESALDKMEEEEEFRERLRQKQKKGPQQPANKHPLWPEIEKWTNQQLKYAKEAVEGGVWQLFNEDGEMKMYRRELEEEGLVVDPLKAIHQVKGVTAHEMAHHFWSPDVRFEWDSNNHRADDCSRHHFRRHINILAITQTCLANRTTRRTVLVTHSKSYST